MHFVRCVFHVGIGVSPDNQCNNKSQKILKNGLQPQFWPKCQGFWSHCDNDHIYPQFFVTSRIMNRDETASTTTNTI